MVRFAIEKIKDEPTGQELDAVVKITGGTGAGAPEREDSREVWCTILDLDRLFGACAAKWAGNWNLDKVIDAIKDSEIQ